MLIVNTETIPGKEIIEALGIARGSTVRARNVGRDIFAGLKNLVGGEIDEYYDSPSSSVASGQTRITSPAALD